MANESAEKNAPLQKSFDKEYITDSFPQKILDLRRKDTKHSKEISLTECTELDSRLLYQECLYVPDYSPLRLRIMKLYYNAPSAGYPGYEKIFELVSREYYWPNIREYIRQFIRNCYVCQRSKATTHGKLGMLQPLPIPEHISKLYHL